MAARLKRIKELISKERKLAGGVLGNEFDKELDVIIDENTQLKGDQKKLEALVKNLKAQLKKGQYSKQGAGKMLSLLKGTAVEKDQEDLLSKLKTRLKENIKEIDALREENALLRKGQPQSEPSAELIK